MWRQAAEVISVDDRMVMDVMSVDANHVADSLLPTMWLMPTVWLIY